MREWEGMWRSGRECGGVRGNVEDWKGVWREYGGVGRESREGIA